MHKISITKSFAHTCQNVFKFLCIPVYRLILNFNKKFQVASICNENLKYQIRSFFFNLFGVILIMHSYTHSEKERHTELTHTYRERGTYTLLYTYTHKHRASV